MKVALDISALDPNFKEHAQRGIGRYVGELKKYFDSLGPTQEPQISYFDHRNVGGKLTQLVSKAIDYLPAGRATLKQQIVLPYLYSDLGKQTLLHFPAHMDAPARGMPDYVLTVLDLIPQVLSKLYKADKANWRFRLARRLENDSIRNAKLLLCISECTARDVNRVLGVPWEKLRVTHLGIDEKFFQPSTSRDPDALKNKMGLSSNRPMILYVGGIDPRKNWSFALKVMKELFDRAKGESKAVPLLLMVGKIDRDREFPRLQAAISELGLQEHIKFLGFVPDAELLELYTLCSAFFFPSLYEGFGLPPLEAMAAGLPVVSSNLSCMPEILGEGALLIDPTNVREAVQALSALLNKNIDVEVLKQKAQSQARKFNWNICGAKTLSCYRELSDSPNICL